MASRNNGSSSINTASQLATLNANTTNMANDISAIKDDIKELKGQYVTIDQFIPIRNLVYGFVALILVAVIGAMISFFIVQSPSRASLTTPATSTQVQQAK